MPGTFISDTKAGRYGRQSWCWLIALIEYCLAVPANRIGHKAGYSLFELKIIQEVITLTVFGVFAVFVMKESFHWKYLVSFALLLGAVYFTFTKRFG